jgi:hypothetical protein
MDFSAEQRFVLDVGDVEDGLTDPSFLGTLGDLTTIGEPDVLDTDRSADAIVQRVRYRFVAELPGAVTKVVDPDKLTWVEEARYDLAAHTSTHTIVPDHYENLIEARYSGSITVDGDGAARSVTGAVKVHVALVGHKVERVIVNGLRDFAREQADRLNTWLRQEG